MVAPGAAAKCQKIGKVYKEFGKLPCNVDTLPHSRKAGIFYCAARGKFRRPDMTGMHRMLRPHIFAALAFSRIRFTHPVDLFTLTTGYKQDTP